MLMLNPEIVPRERRRLLGNNVFGHYTYNLIGNTSPSDFLNYMRNAVIEFTNERRQNKLQTGLVCIMMRVDPATGIVTNEEEVSFNSFQESIYESTDLEEEYERMTTKILESFATYLKNGSGYVLKRVVRLDMTFSRLKPLRGSSYISLPKRISRKNALINVKNEDDYCFKYHATIGYFNLTDEYYPSSQMTEELREYVERLNWGGIKFPTPCSEREFKKFEKNNKASSRVFGCEILPNNTKIIPLYVSREKYEKIVRLFFYKNEDGTVCHYNTVKDMSRLVSSQISEKRARRFICDFCLNPFARRNY